jgi:hypothetical protein
VNHPHFHDGNETRVSEGYLSDIPEEALREFLTFAQERMKG